VRELCGGGASLGGGLSDRRASRDGHAILCSSRLIDAEIDDGS
jgi:hypothetical protein